MVTRWVSEWSLSVSEWSLIGSASGHFVVTHWVSEWSLVGLVSGHS